MTLGVEGMVLVLVGDQSHHRSKHGSWWEYGSSGELEGRRMLSTCRVASLDVVVIVIQLFLDRTGQVK